MSNNRTRWLDKLRPAGASSGGWTEGPMAPVETTDAATVDQRCPFQTSDREETQTSDKVGTQSFKLDFVCHLAHGTR